MRRFVLWVAALLITFAVGVGADKLWLHVLTPAPVLKQAEPLAIEISAPQKEVVFVPAPAPSPTPPRPNLILDYDPEKFSVWAVFYVMGSKPKEFADFETVEAMLTPESADYPGTIYITTLKDDEYDSASATFGLVTERQLFFATSKLETGFEYRFDGEFLRTDFDAVQRKTRPFFAER